ncbi:MULTISPECIES: Crp/Fnr family transcriptional regulator [Myroides]|uniref:Cyclic nucleotide-binding domain-containing protein n=1 Tax=Myroides albus TaxID=2562892 RepID=A0A6I3LL08_9FLAO|nr:MULTISPECIES: Crp/Fnr family transcriptional regulator [Myroides]MTG97191.1 cyclic nucleotide-binding domain-containing protein [Myroides albus]MVX35188.1 cyclic nucleotide-binding domain-containing protein [Myroides sp. LoEW2-1]UVD78933.1 Crp/Fnr family transcriptional regulator [Myroides albus]
MISVELLLQYSAEIKEYKKGEVIFQEGHYPSHYYQVLLGKVKMNNYSADGKEFIQNIFASGQSFGEPPLFIDECYPANAIAVTQAKVIQLPKAEFYVMMQENNEVSLAINKSLSKRLYYKSIMAPDIATQDSENRIMTLLNYLKTHQHSGDDNQRLLIDLTRQQIADMTGLRVETVIRTLKRLESIDKVEIVNSKIVI